MIAGPPITRLALVEVHHGVDQSGVFALCRDDGQTRPHQFGRIRCDKGLAGQGGDIPTAENGLAIVGDAAGPLGKVCGQVHVGRGDQPPDVAEDLAADLLGHRRAVLGNGARPRGGDAVEQVEIGRVLRGNAVAAPPKGSSLVSHIVEQGLADLGRGDMRSVVLYRPD